MKLVLLLIIAFPTFANAQKNEDTKIIITLENNIDLYKKVKIALVNFDFIVKDNYNLDTLTTYAREFTTIQGHCRVTAIIKQNTVEISGIYSLKRLNEFGYTQLNKDYQNIIFYKGSKAWALLMNVAEMIGGEISYSK